MGNFNTQHYSEEVEEQLKNLENAYDDKMDQWGDDFEEKLEGWFGAIFGE